jgi:DNA topoisomerase-1
MAGPDPEDSAREAGLRHSSDARPGITRRASGRGFSYRGPDGKPVRDKATLARIASLAIPPAYTDVWICPDPRGHLQATGRDAKGRKQFRYHPRWREHRDATKYDRMEAFAALLPALRERVAADLRRQGLPREKVLATVVRLLETTLIRVGNEEYARANGSFGLTTLRARHVAVEGEAAMRFSFTGKSGQKWRLRVEDRRVARVIRALQELPGQELFACPDEDGALRPVTSQEVNDYLRSATGEDITAKDFRTWAATVLCGLALAEAGPGATEAETKRRLRAAIAQVAARLGNTPTVCRSCYIHPGVMARYAAGDWALSMEEAAEGGLRPEEAAVLVALQQAPAASPKPAGRGARDATLSSPPAAG